jgi:hypothetical protein
LLFKDSSVLFFKYHAFCYSGDGWLFFRPAAAGLARPVSIQISALRSGLEKPPTDPASAGRG